jgi:toxin ParE1/3/4
MAHLRSLEAEFDLDDIWHHTATQSGSVETADRLIDSLTERFCLLGLHPFLGRTRDYDLRPGLRSFPVGEYVIFYRLQDEDVLMLRVLRGSRDLSFFRPVIAQFPEGFSTWSTISTSTIAFCGSRFSPSCS